MGLKRWKNSHDNEIYAEYFDAGLVFLLLTQPLQTVSVKPLLCLNQTVVNKCGIFNIGKKPKPCECLENHFLGQNLPLSSDRTDSMRSHEFWKKINQEVM